MNPEAGQVWTNDSGVRYKVIRVEDGKVVYTFQTFWKDYSLERCVSVSQFTQVINEQDGYYLLTELTKALL